MPAVNVLARLVRLTRAERRLLVGAFGRLLAMRVRMHWQSLPQLRAHVDRMTSRNPGPRTLRQAAWAVNAVANRLPGMNCLSRSLALQALLRDAGIPSELRIGVAKDAQGAFIAHAWVVCEGQTIDFLADLSRYTPLPLPRN